jgi:hypothetical protein
MKRINKLAVALAIVGSLLLVSGGACLGAVWCVDGTVTQAGINPTDSPPNIYQIKLECSGLFAGTRQYFLSYESMGDAGYATVLTAIATGVKADVLLAAATPDSLVERILIKATPVVE